MTGDPPRYPFEPLARAMGLSPAAACRQLRVSGTTEQDYRTRGVTWKVADRLATRAGFHPWVIWPELRERQLAEALRTCAGDDCDETFIPYTGAHLYCSRRCARRAHRQRHKAANPTAAAERSRAWRAANPEHHRRYNRDYQRVYMRRVRASQRAQRSDAA